MTTVLIYLPISPTLEAKSRPCCSVSACLDMMANRLFPWTGPVGARIRRTHADKQVKVVDFIVKLNCLLRIKKFCYKKKIFIRSDDTFLKKMIIIFQIVNGLTIYQIKLLLLIVIFK